MSPRVVRLRPLLPLSLSLSTDRDRERSGCFHHRGHPAKTRNGPVLQIPFHWLRSDWCRWHRDHGKNVLRRKGGFLKYRLSLLPFRFLPCRSQGRRQRGRRRSSGWFLTREFYRPCCQVVAELPRGSSTRPPVLARCASLSTPISLWRGRRVHRRLGRIPLLAASIRQSFGDCSRPA